MTYPQNPQPEPGPPYPMVPNGGYGQPVYPMPAYLVPPPPKGLSIASMVLALVSILAGFTFLVPIAALILGIIGLRKEPAGRGMALTGVILSSLILLVWAIIVVVFIVLGFSIFGIALTSSSQPS